MALFFLSFAPRATVGKIRYKVTPKFYTVHLYGIGATVPRAPARNCGASSRGGGRPAGVWWWVGGNSAFASRKSYLCAGHNFVKNLF